MGVGGSLRGVAWGGLMRGCKLNFSSFSSSLRVFLGVDGVAYLFVCLRLKREPLPVLHLCRASYPVLSCSFPIPGEINNCVLTAE